MLENSGQMNATPVAESALARCLSLGLLHIFGQTGATPVALTSTRPLHCPLRNIQETDWCKARGFPFHSAVAPASLAPFHPDSSNARAMHSTRALACQLLLFCSAEGSNARGTCPLGRWGPSFHIFRFRGVTTLPLLKRISSSKFIVS